MNLSLDEYRALVAKAFRGVGYPWGLTEDASWAARRLAEIDRRSPTAVLSLLEQVDQLDPASTPVLAGMPVSTSAPTWSSDGDALCPVCVGTTLLDRGPVSLGEAIVLGPTRTPALLVPFLYELIASPVDALVVDWGEGTFRLSAGQTELTGGSPEIVDSVTIRLDPKSAAEDGADAQQNWRVRLEHGQIEQFEKYAHRTYAPATEASRQGAGAGTTDND